MQRTHLEPRHRREPPTESVAGSRPPAGTPLTRPVSRSQFVTSAPYPGTLGSPARVSGNDQPGSVLHKGVEDPLVGRMRHADLQRTAEGCLGAPHEVGPVVAEGCAVVHPDDVDPAPLDDELVVPVGQVDPAA